MIRLLTALVVPLLLAGILAWIPWVQTRLAAVLTAQLEKRLELQVSIERVHLRFLNSIDIHGIYLEDYHGDTLIYTHRIQAKIQHLWFRRADYALKRLTIKEPVIKLIRYRDSEQFDYQVLFKRLNRDTASERSPELSLRLNNLLLSNASVHFRDAQNPEHSVKYHLQDLNLDFSELLYDGQRTKVVFNSGSGIETQGFELQKLEGQFAHAPGAITFDHFKLHTARNIAEWEGRIDYDSLNAPMWYERLNWDVAVGQIVFDPTEFHPYLPPGIFPDGLAAGKVSGHILGKLSDFETTDFCLEYDRNTVLDGDLEVVGLPDTDKLYVQAPDLYLTTNWEDLKRLQALIPELVLPEEAQNLEYIVLSSSFEGYLNDFRTSMEVRTAHGELQADLQVRFPAARPLEMTYKGTLAASGWDLGAMLQNEDLGYVDLNLVADGYGLTADLLNTDLSGQIDRFGYRGYTYGKGEMTGHLKEGLFEGHFLVRDPRLTVDLDGTIDLRSQRPALSFRLDVATADLFALGLVEDSVAYLNTSINAAFSGIGPDDAQGTLNIGQTSYETEEALYFMKYMDLASRIHSGQRHLEINSDLLKGKVEGAFTISSLISSIQGHCRQYYEGLNAPEPSETQQLTYECTLYNTLPITELLFPDLTIETGTRLYGSYDDQENRIQLQLNAPGFGYRDYRMQHALLSVGGDGHSLQSALSAEYIELPDGSQVDTFLLQNHTWHDSSLFNIYWTYMDSSSFAGSLHPYLTLTDSSTWVAGFRPSNLLYLGDSIAIPGGNRILANEREVEFHNLVFRHFDQSVAINGSLSEDFRKSLNLTFDHLRMEYLDPLINDRNTRLHGGITGELRLFDVYNEFNMIGNIAIDSLALNEHYVGEFTAGINRDDEMNAFAIKGDIYRGQLHTLDLSGAYFPGNMHNRVQLRMNLNKMRVDAASKYTEAYLTNLRGALDARLELVIEGRDLSLTGWAELRKIGFTVQQTAVDYNVDGVPRVEFNDQSIDFKEFRFRDYKYQTPGRVYGSILHRGLRNWSFDLHVQVDSTLVLDTGHGEYYYGTAFGTGRLDIVGPLDRIRLAIDAAAETGTRFALPLGGTSSVSEHSFISFVDRSTTPYRSGEVNERKGRSALHEMIFDVEIKEGVETELIFDETVGDILKGTGTGSFIIRMAEDRTMTMSGDYTIYDGTYLFTLQNLFSKRFNIKRGGTLKWSGNPYDAEIDLTASYPTRASLKPLEVSDSSRRRRPVEVNMKLTNQLMKPNIEFGIQVPNANTALQEEVDLVVTRNENELNRQVISLLVMGSFITPETSTTGSNSGLINQGLTANTTEMLSNQLSRWISDINENFDIGVNYEVGNELNSEQVEFALSTQLFNDRVLLNSNIGVPLEGGENTSNLVGNVEVEVKVSGDGRFRVKAFNRSDQNDPLSQQYQYRQGVGLVYTADFDHFSEFWRVITGQNTNRE